jgi:hypothetical protein
MAELILAAGAAYLGYKAARRVRSAYSSAKQEMYEEQEWGNYYNQPDYYNQQYNYHQYPNGSSNNYHHSHRHHSGYSYPSGHSYGYRY